MTNEYIEVVKRWIAGEEVSVEVLNANAKAAADAARVADAAAYAAAYAAYAAARAADEAAVYWVERYEKLTNDK